jgi:hypothetical protein
LTETSQIYCKTNYASRELNELPNRINTKISTKRHIGKMLKVGDKKKILKVSKRNITHYLQGNTNKIQSLLLRRHYGARRQQDNIFKVLKE